MIKLSDAWVAIDKKHLQDERWDVLSAALEVLAEGLTKSNRPEFITSMAEAVIPHCETLEKPIEISPGMIIRVKLSGLASLAREDGKVYFTRNGNKVQVG